MLLASRSVPYCVRRRMIGSLSNYCLSPVSLIQYDLRVTGRLSAAIRRHTEWKSESTDQLGLRTDARSMLPAPGDGKRFLFFFFPFLSCWDPLLLGVSGVRFRISLILNFVYFQLRTTGPQDRRTTEIPMRSHLSIKSHHVHHVRI